MSNEILKSLWNGSTCDCTKIECFQLLNKRKKSLIHRGFTQADSQSSTDSTWLRESVVLFGRKLHFSFNKFDTFGFNSTILKVYIYCSKSVNFEGTCPCRANIETTEHFLFDCHLYHSLKAPMLHSCRNIPWPPPLHFFTSSTQKLTLLK